jgi:YVTN family beta-propeller protein
LPLDPASGAFGTLVYGGTKPYRVLLSPDGARAYLANLGDSTISVFDSQTLAESAKIRVPPNPTSLAITRDGSRLYVAGQDTGSMSVIDTNSNEVLSSVRIGTMTREVAVSPDGKTVFVSNVDGVTVVDAGALIPEP